jgi:hypothetical protein
MHYKNINKTTIYGSIKNIKIYNYKNKMTKKN